MGVSKHQDDCAAPVWANLFFVDDVGDTAWNGSVAFHGLPRKGDIVEHSFPDGEGVPDLFGRVMRVRYGTVVDGSFKATVVVQLEVTDGKA